MWNRNVMNWSGCWGGGERWDRVAVAVGGGLGDPGGISAKWHSSET